MASAAPHVSAKQFCTGCTEWEERVERVVLEKGLDDTRKYNFAQLTSGRRLGCTYCTAVYESVAAVLPPKCTTGVYAQNCQLDWYPSGCEVHGLLVYQALENVPERFQYTLELFNPDGECSS